MRTRLLLAAACLAGGGCGDGGRKPPPAVPVTGTLTYKHPQKGPVPAAGALVVFNPIPGDDKNLYFPQGTVRPDGSFALTTAADGDGAPPGEYGVTVLWKAGAKPSGGEERGGEDRLGRRYADPKAPRFKQTVAAGQPNHFELTVE